MSNYSVKALFRKPWDVICLLWGWPPVGTRITFGIVLVLMVAMLYSIHNEEKRWQRYSSENACEAVATTKSRVVATLVTNPSTGIPVHGTTVIPGTTTYECADGKRHTR